VEDGQKATVCCGGRNTREHVVCLADKQLNDEVAIIMDFSL